MENKNDSLNNEEIPTLLPVIPTIDVVVFPQMVVPLLILDEKIIAGIEQALEGSKKILLLAAHQQPNSFQSPISINDLYQVGTVGNIMRVMHLPDGGLKVLTQGIAKAYVKEIVAENDQLAAQIQPIPLDEAIYDGEAAEKQIQIH